MLHTVPTVCALNQKHENKAPQSLYHSAWKLCHAFSTFCFFKPTNTHFSLTHTNSTDYLLPFFFFSPSHKEHTHTNTLKLLGLASGVVINHQSEWLWFLQHQQSRGVGGRGWGLGGGAQGRWAGEEAAAKWLPSLPVSVEPRTSDCSASGCDTL